MVRSPGGLGRQVRAQLTRAQSDGVIVTGVHLHQTRSVRAAVSTTIRSTLMTSFRQQLQDPVSIKKSITSGLRRWATDQRDRSLDASQEGYLDDFYWFIEAPPTKLPDASMCSREQCVSSVGNTSQLLLSRPAPHEGAWKAFARAW